MGNDPRRLSDDREGRENHPLRFPPFNPFFPPTRHGPAGSRETAGNADRAAL